MASKSIEWVAPAADSRRGVSLEILVRFALSAVAVGVCYCFSWQWLRALTCTANLVADSWIGVHLQRVSADTVVFRGHLYWYAIACTLADAWCGALPLLWQRRVAWLQNLQTIGEFTAGLFLFNVVRLTTSDWLVAHGASWDWGHSVFCGCAYFLVWLWVVRPGQPLDRFWTFGKVAPSFPERQAKAKT